MAKSKKEMKTPRGTARAARRAVGNYEPVNPDASLKEAPEGRFAATGKYRK